MADTMYAAGFLVVVVGGVLTLLFGMYLEYRQNLARIKTGILTNPGDTTGARRVLGWGLGLASGGISLFLGSLMFGLPGETGSEGQGLGLVIGALGAAALAYAFLAPRMRE
ncbi:MAG: hypothetical protein O3B84_01720 [Chloroflexi bacterium]|nr:hypothetical protein [Chloroflexota bacterium]